MRFSGLKVHRITSWLLIFFALLTVLLGYISSRRLFPPYELFIFLHLAIQWILISTTVLHLILSRKYMKLKLHRIIEGLKSERAYPTSLLRLIQRITKWGIIILAILIGLSGLIYFEWFALIFGDYFLFDWHIDYDLLLTLFIIIHIGIGAQFYLTRKKINHWGLNLLIFLVCSSLMIVVGVVNIPPGPQSYDVKIGDKLYDFDPVDDQIQINSIRSDIFQPGSFSLFDILLYLNSTSEINITYHFDASMNTYVIDKINGEENWWYFAYYSGGGREANAVRIDFYPWKRGTTLIMLQKDQSYIDGVYSTFQEEVSRLAANNGTVTVPVVTINGRTFNQEFYGISVSAHNLRNDIFQNGVITAIDIIISLSDLGHITYELNWFESFRGAFYVHSYFVEKINADETIGRCGFLYEVGDNDFRYPGQNYIFLASDERVIVSPEYLRFFWDCL